LTFVFLLDSPSKFWRTCCEFANLNLYFTFYFIACKSFVPVCIMPSKPFSL
jgi:hypothetical protein